MTCPHTDLYYYMPHYPISRHYCLLPGHYNHLTYLVPAQPSPPPPFCAWDDHTLPITLQDLPDYTLDLTNMPMQRAPFLPRDNLFPPLPQTTICILCLHGFIPSALPLAFVFLLYYFIGTQRVVALPLPSMHAPCHFSYCSSSPFSSLLYLPILVFFCLVIHVVWFPCIPLPSYLPFYLLHWTLLYSLGPVPCSVFYTRCITLLYLILVCCKHT